jgi:FSR family fosmidomycin resistance protein-like MFS transporter
MSDRQLFLRSEAAGCTDGAAPASPESYPSAVARPNVRLIGALALGHLVVDANQGALPALLPFLKVAHGLSYTAAGALILAGNLASSMIQPVFGYFTDRQARRWILPVGVLLSGFGLALTGVARGFTTLMGLFVLLSLGNAAYHPEGFKATASLSGDRRATALSWFSLGGNIGFALGPPVVAAIVTELGLYGSVGMSLPAILAALVLAAVLPGLNNAAFVAPLHVSAPSAPTMKRAMVVLMLVVMLRSWVQLGFVTYMPFYYVDYLKEAPGHVGMLLFVFLGCGALGTMLAGPLADRIGARPLILGAFMLSVPLAVLFLLTRAGTALFVLGLFGAVLTSTFPMTVVLAQEYMPRNAGLASGLVVGFAIGTGGLGVGGLGWMADRFGLTTVLWTCALLPVTGLAAALFLPRPGLDGESAAEQRGTA